VTLQIKIEVDILEFLFHQIK